MSAPSKFTPIREDGLEECVECYSPTPSPTPTPSASPTPTPSPTSATTNAPPVANPGSNAGSISDVANQRFNQMITNRVLGTVLLGVNEQVNCNDCVSAFGSAGSFSAGIHGRKNLTDNLALLAGLAYTHYSEGGYSVTSAPIGALALRYDFTDWGSSRPFFDIGTLLTPYEKVRYRRNYTTSLGAVTVDGNSTARITPSMAGPGGSAGSRRATRSQPRSRSGNYGSGLRVIPISSSPSIHSMRPSTQAPTRPRW